MPSKKKTRGKARRVAKSRRATEDAAAAGIDSQMQRLQISSNNNEEALLEAAINLAAAEKEELAAAAKNDVVGNAEKCLHGHGFIQLPKEKLDCVVFIDSFSKHCKAFDEKKTQNGVFELFESFWKATKRKYADAWTDPDKLQSIVSYFLQEGTHAILKGIYARHYAMYASFFEQWVAKGIYEGQASCDSDEEFQVLLCFLDWGKIHELLVADEHTLVSFFKKRIPCQCLDKKYEEVKSITKIGLCLNTSCSLPDMRVTRSEMFYCTQCREANYCSRECQVAHWQHHKNFCVRF